MSDNQSSTQRLLNSLQREHRHLDESISRLNENGQAEPLQLNRLKKRKLLLKDQITKLQSRLIPDLNG